MRLLLPFLLLLGCESTTVIGDSGDADADTDTDTDTDTDADTDTGEPLPDPDLAWNVTGDTDGLAFSLVSLDLVEFQMADILAEAEVEERIELALGPAPEEMLIEVPDAPGLYIAYFLAGLHEDDGDGKWDPDETWHGVAPSVVVYLDGVVSPEMVDLGLHVGWNAMVVTDDAPDVVDPLEQDLVPTIVNTVEVGGTWDESVPDDDRVTTLAAVVFEGVMTEPLDDQALGSGSWTLTLSGEPPADHYLDIDENGTTEGVELFAAYVDGNHDHYFDPTQEAGTGFACFEGKIAVGYWVNPPTNLVDLFPSGSPAAPGWNLLAFEGDNATFLTPGEGMDLELSASCWP